MDDNRISEIVKRYNRDHNIKSKDGIDYNGIASHGIQEFGVDEIRAHTHRGSQDPESDLNAMTGLGDVKKQVMKLKSRLDFFNASGESQEYISGNHMCFLGPPGTGKTTVARIMSGILYQSGCVRSDFVIETDAEYFKSSPDFVKKTEKTIAAAMGGVLFVDEAYLLFGDRKGYEITAMLLKAMEDAKDEFVVILAGYEGEMKEMISQNPGLKSRIKNVIYFSKYNPDELCEITVEMGKKLKLPFTFDKDALDLLNQQYEIECRRTDFANARECRNVLDKVVDIHTYNYMSQGGEETRYVLTYEDVAEYIEERNQTLMRDYEMIDYGNNNWEMRPTGSVSELI